jgi:hypothetical protein
VSGPPRPARLVSDEPAITRSRGAYANVFHDEVVQDEGIASSTLAETNAEAAQVGGEAELLRPVGVDISEGDNLAYDDSSLGAYRSRS